VTPTILQIKDVLPFCWPQCGKVREVGQGERAQSHEQTIGENNAESERPATRNAYIKPS
jgi:hypothetical protein